MLKYFFLLFYIPGCIAQTQIKQLKVNDSIYVLPASFVALTNDSIKIEAINTYPQIFERFFIEGNYIYENPIKIKADKPMSIRIDFQILPDYESILSNALFVDQNNLEFDVMIEVNGTLTLTAYQIALDFNQNIKGDGVLSFAYIPGSSQLNLIPEFGIGINENKLTFGSNAGNEQITGTKRIGKFRLTNTHNFILFDPQINWSFTGMVTTILTGVNFANITNPTNFKPLQSTQLLIKFN